MAYTDDHLYIKLVKHRPRRILGKYSKRITLLVLIPNLRTTARVSIVAYCTYTQQGGSPHRPLSESKKVLRVYVLLVTTSDSIAQ
jgi:hypothetical protein